MELVRDCIPPENSGIIALDNISITYVQEPDCTESREDDYQTITFETRNGGSGPFYTVKTSRWSFENPKDLLELAKDFESRLMLNTKSSDEF